MDNEAQRWSALLRLIAEETKERGKRDIKEAIERGEQSLYTDTYHLDLIEFATMLEGTHHTHQLKITRKRGRPGGLTIDRQMEIVRFIAEARDKPGGTVAKGIDNAMTKFNISNGSAKAAWRLLRKALDPIHGDLFLYCIRLEAKNMAKISVNPNGAEK